MKALANTNVAIFVEDDLLRSGLSEILREAGSSILNAAKAPAVAAPRDNTNLVLCDVTYHGHYHEEAIEGIREAYPNAAIAVVTSLVDSQVFLKAVLSGARGFFSKDIDRDALLACLEAVVVLDAV